MTHEEKRIWLIKKLLSESIEYREYQIPGDEQEQKDMLRSLMNVRMPYFISDEFLQIQDEYLQVENAKDGYVDIDNLKPVVTDDMLYLWQGDITRLKVDAIVNAANSKMLGCFQPLHSCIDNIIHSKAGIQLRLECNRLMEEQGHDEPTGYAKITKAYNLPSKYIIHTVGTIVNGNVTNKNKEELESCYISCIKLADEYRLNSIAFCCISTGVFGFPNELAANIAVNSIKQYKKETKSNIEVIFNVFKECDYEIYKKLLG